MTIQRNPEAKWELTDDELSELENRIDIIGQNGNDGQHYEYDPSGIPAHNPGAKLDGGKPRVGLVLGEFSRALIEVAKVGTYGAGKYSDSGWLQVVNGKGRYEDAGLRHYFAEKQGEVCDADSGLYHSAHACWNFLARLELYLREKENASTTSD